MKRYLFILTAALCSFTLLPGCAWHCHERPTQYGVERDSTHTLLMTHKASQLQTVTKDGNYSRSLALGSLESAGDTAMAESIARGVAQGLTSSMGMPKLPGAATPAAPLPEPTVPWTAPLNGNNPLDQIWSSTNSVILTNNLVYPFSR